MGAGFPNHLESRYVALNEVQEAFRVGERDTLTELRQAARDMTDDLLARLRAGKIQPRTLDGQRRSAFKGARRVRGALRRQFKRIGADGIKHVGEELNRQAAA